jgi:hypothetical protein
LIVFIHVHKLNDIRMIDLLKNINFIL